MKKFITILSLVLLFIGMGTPVSAQVSTFSMSKMRYTRGNVPVPPYLTVKAVPIWNTIDVFAKELGKKGCTVAENALDSYSRITLNGDFAGYNGCIFNVFGSPITKSTYMVSVQVPLPNIEMFDINYEVLYNSYVAKYGEPIDKGTPGLKFNPVIWKTEAGTIEFRGFDNPENPHILINYKDNWGVKTRDEESVEIIETDI